jgi:tetratricopeptide (TPR) repeat protein
VAVEWLARAYKLEPSADTAWHLGQLYSELDATKDALTALTNATRLGLAQEKRRGQLVPWLTEALYQLGRVYMDAGKERAARSAWQKYVARNPKAGAQLDEVRRELATTLQRD